MNADERRSKIEELHKLRVQTQREIDRLIDEQHREETWPRLRKLVGRCFRSENQSIEGDRKIVQIFRIVGYNRREQFPRLRVAMMWRDTKGKIWFGPDEKFQKDGALYEGNQPISLARFKREWAKGIRDAQKLGRPTPNP